MTEAKMAAHIGFVNLYKTVTTDYNISSEIAKTKITVHTEFLNFCMAWASIPSKRDFFHFSYPK